MRRYLLQLAVVLLMLMETAGASLAADGKAIVKVALLDITSAMPTGMMGYGMMGPGMMGAWAPSQRQGYPGMMGSGMMGPGMMGGMMSIRTDQAIVKTGPVSFEVTNWSRSILHEMLVVAVDNPNAPLPYDYAQARVPEDQVKVLGEASDLKPNVSETFDVTLAPGSYLLICNLPGHYASGMTASITVTP